LSLAEELFAPCVGRNFAGAFSISYEVEDFSDSARKMGQKGTKNAILSFPAKYRAL